MVDLEGETAKIVHRMHNGTDSDVHCLEDGKYYRMVASDKNDLYAHSGVHIFLLYALLFIALILPHLVAVIGPRLSDQLFKLFGVPGGVRKSTGDGQSLLDKETDIEALKRQVDTLRFKLEQL